jgi:hypothetical protein
VSCGQTITKNTTLTADVGPCATDGIIIGADNITLNLNGRRVFGNSDQGASGEFAGIRLAGRTGVTVTGHRGKSGKTGTVSGFEAGVVIDGGSANTVQNVTARDNIGIDNARLAELGDGIIVFDSPANRILNNIVIHNGIFDGIGVLGSASDNSTIQGNTVEDTIGPSPLDPFVPGGPAGQGIIVNGADGATSGVITGTKIEGNIIRRSGSAGIANINHVDGSILRNIVEGNGFTNTAGNGIGIQAGMGFEGELATRILVQGNEVHGNGTDGIQVQRGALENRIIENDAADNNARPILFRGFDLRDLNTDCDANVWSGNIWGSGLFFPECVTVGGSGPPIPQGPEGPFGDPSCTDGLDNDRDGLTDFEEDGCLRPEGPEGDFTCADASDNDRDGLIDGADPGCQSDAAPVPEGPAGDPTCSDRIDNDRDGLIDSFDLDCLGGDGELEEEPPVEEEPVLEE